jgi:phosphatidate phosphatase APP1
VAAFYRALEAGSRGNAAAAGAGNPIFYVSSSPWNLYDVITEFLEAQHIPAGPLLLRDWDFGRALLRTGKYKSAAIDEILRSYPTLPFILVGDSGQEDPEIYSAVVREHAGRILAVYIRNVTSHPERSAAIQALAAGVQDAGSTLVLADDTLTVARHAAAHGWIDSNRLAEIGVERRADEGTSGAKVETPGVETDPKPAPTVVVDPEVKRRDVE